VPKIVLHHLQDWAVSRHLVPVLRAAGVPEAALGCVHYFHVEGVADPFASLPEGEGFPDAADALLTASVALGALGHALADAEEDELEFGIHWSATEEDLAAAAKKHKLTVVAARGSAPAGVDAVGVALDARRAEGQSDAQLIAWLGDGAKRGDDGSRPFVLLSFFACLESLLAAGEDTLRSLLAAADDLPVLVRDLAGRAALPFCSDERLATLELDTIEALSRLGYEPLTDRTVRSFRKRVLASEAPSLARLLGVFDGASGALKGRERARFDALWKAAVARDEHTLEQWVYALNRKVIDRATFERQVVGPFRRAVEAGFKDASGFGDEKSFVESAPVVASTDPDLALAGFIALSKNYNESGLRLLADDAKLLPKKGYSAAALSAAAAHFGQPARRSATKIFAKHLAAWGIEPKSARPPALETIDVTLHVGTDVATLLVGAFDAVEKISDTEDLDCARLVRKTKSLGFATGGDGWYRVRVLGAADERAAACVEEQGGKPLGVAPLRITGDALTVSGVVGGGGAPTIPFPSGTYAAHVFSHAEGPLRLTVVVREASKPPAWPFGKSDALPWI
jgi:hypothetical protein